MQVKRNGKYLTMFPYKYFFGMIFGFKILIFVPKHKFSRRCSKSFLVILLLHMFRLISLYEKCSYSEFFWSVFSRIQSECGKIWTRKTPNTALFIYFSGSVYHRFSFGFLTASLFFDLTLKYGISRNMKADNIYFECLLSKAEFSPWEPSNYLTRSGQKVSIEISQC